ncbi:hypothetical protein JZ751_007606 [Albula glossodonta]|uniref:Uncharacterized protein n=1 Tax=Albula glossodonta TaxID=121402 RepID=A0A8T2N7C6_9TELE|nr:hypothetical protein JZ751_007606 [Albula glossodonta]
MRPLLYSPSMSCSPTTLCSRFVATDLSRGSLSDEHGGVVSVLARQAVSLTRDPTDTPTEHLNEKPRQHHYRSSQDGLLICEGKSTTPVCLTWQTHEAWDSPRTFLTATKKRHSLFSTQGGASLGQGEMPLCAGVREIPRVLRAQTIIHHGDMLHCAPNAHAARAWLANVSCEHVPRKHFG